MLSMHAISTLRVKVYATRVPWPGSLSGLRRFFASCVVRHMLHSKSDVRSRFPLHLLRLGLCVFLPSCTHQRRILDDHCELTDEHEITTLVGSDPDDIALLPNAVAYSEDAGLYMVALEPGSAPRRLGEACAGGLAQVGDFLACSRPGHDAKDVRGHVAVYQNERVLFRVEGVGPDGRGVGIAERNGELALVWNEGRTGASILGIVIRAADGTLSERTRLSRGGLPAGEPAILTVDDEFVIVWPETWPNREGDLEGALMSQRLASLDAPLPRARELEELAYDSAHPSLRLGAQGEPVLVFRDRRPEGTRPHLYLRHLDADSAVREGVHANAAGESFAIPCADALTVFAPRTHSRGERIVAVRRHNPTTLEGEGPEHQVYQHGTTFDYADARCVSVAGSPRGEARDALLVMASSASDEHPLGAIRSVRFSCPNPE